MTLSFWLGLWCWLTRHAWFVERPREPAPYPPPGFYPWRPWLEIDDHGQAWQNGQQVSMPDRPDDPEQRKRMRWVD